MRVILPTPDSNWSSKVVVQLEDGDAKEPLSNDCMRSLYVHGEGVFVLAP